MKSQKYFLLLLLCISLLACKDKKQYNDSNTELLKIHVDIDKKSKLPVFQKFDYVKLENNDNCLISGVSKVIPFDNKLFILSKIRDGIVIVFDENGKFLYKINKGRASNELIYPTDICINKKTKTLSVID